MNIFKENMIVAQAIFTGKPEILGSSDAKNPMDREWRTSIFKHQTDGPVFLGKINLAGDEQADLKHHGGPEKAVFAYPSEHYAMWQKEFGNIDIRPGGMGENFSVTHLLEKDVAIGDIFEIGEAVIQVSQPRQPCWKPARRFRTKDFAWMMQSTGRTGWYFRVLQEGHVEAGQSIRLIERLHPEWTVAECNRIMHIDRGNFEEAARLADLKELAVNWRNTLAKRVASRQLEDITNRLYGPNI